jgi:hypothetical protein
MRERKEANRMRNPHCWRGMLLALALVAPAAGQWGFSYHAGYGPMVHGHYCVPHPYVYAPLPCAYGYVERRYYVAPPVHAYHAPPPVYRPPRAHVWWGF